MAYPDPPPLLTLLENPKGSSVLPWLGSGVAVQEFLGLQQYHINCGPVGHAKVKPDNIAAHGFYWPA